MRFDSFYEIPFYDIIWKRKGSSLRVFMENDYYKCLMDPMRINSASSIQAEYDRVRKTEEGRLKAQSQSPIYKELQEQTAINLALLRKQEKQIAELEEQNRRLLEQITMLKESEAKDKKRFKLSLIAFFITTSIAIASLVVSIIVIV